jgi:hypothetical protein
MLPTLLNVAVGKYKEKALPALELHRDLPRLPWSETTLLKAQK